jgi:hypothetical protein
MAVNRRAAWTDLSDSQLLAQCAVDTYRASGPGGQKRNKTSSAVRIRHLPSALIVIAEETRSQHENRARALRRLRQALFLKIRDPMPAEALAAGALRNFAGLQEARSPAGRLDVGRKAPAFWPVVGIILDVLEAVGARVSEAAAVLEISTGNLIDFLQAEPKVWEQANILRKQFSLKPLKDS